MTVRKKIATPAMAHAGFWLRVDGDPADRAACWLWRGSTDGRGYGGVNWNVDGKWRRRKAYAVAFELFFGMAAPEARSKKVLRHTCNTRLCVNPYHLVLGSQKQNVEDSRVAGTMCVGEAHPLAVLTDDRVRTARQMHKAGASINELARQYGVNLDTLRKAIRGATWKHVP